MIAKFSVPGEPIPAARPRVTSQGTYIPERVRAHMATIRYHAAANVPRLRRFTGPVWLKAVFYRSTERRCDLDNLLKAVQDALLPHGGWPGLFDDDDQVVMLVANKKLDREKPRTEIAIGAAGEDTHG